MNPGSKEYLKEHNLTQKEYAEWTTSREKYDTNFRQLIIKQYDYASPEYPGSLPNIVTFNDKSYTRIKHIHGYTCDNKECQKRFQMEDKLVTGLHMFYYPSLPIYTCNKQHELCALCLGLGKH